MSIGFTNRGKLRALEAFLQNKTLTGFFIALVTSTSPPTPDTNVFSELEEISSGNGYASGGTPITRDASGFPVVNEDDGADKSSVTMKDVSFTASGGTLPSSGNDIRFVVLTDDDGDIGNREIFAFAEFDSDILLSEGQAVNIFDLLFSLT